MWTNSIGQIYLLNLDCRMDRLLSSIDQCLEYDIPFKRISAIEDKEQGARGLRDTMLLIFKEAIDNDYESILVLEDDFEFVENPNIFMDEVIKQLPQNWHMVLLGCQPTNGFTYRHSANLLNLQKAYATHAVMYSKQCINEVLSMDFGYPIDNWLVDNIQIMGRTYCTFPFLCTQRPGHSDIGKNYIDWRPFMDGRYNQKLAEMPR